MNWTWGNFRLGAFGLADVVNRRLLAPLGLPVGDSALAAEEYARQEAARQGLDELGEENLRERARAHIDQGELEELLPKAPGHAVEAAADTVKDAAEEVVALGWRALPTAVKVLLIGAPLAAVGVVVWRATRR